MKLDAGDFQSIQKPYPGGTSKAFTHVKINDDYLMEDASSGTPPGKEIQIIEPRSRSPREPFVKSLADDFLPIEVTPPKSCHKQSNMKTSSSDGPSSNDGEHTPPSPCDILVSDDASSDDLTRVARRAHLVWGSDASLTEALLDVLEKQEATSVRLSLGGGECETKAPKSNESPTDAFLRRQFEGSEESVKSDKSEPSTSVGDGSDRSAQEP